VKGKPTFTAMPVLGALASALLLFFSMPPWPTSWLGWMAMVPLLFCSRLAEETGSTAKGKGSPFLAWWLFGILFWLASLYWIPTTISTYGGMVPMPLAVSALLAMAAYLALYLGLIGPLLRQGWRLHVPTWLLLPLGLVAGEYLRAHLLTGFPWLLLGHSQWNHPLLIQVADLAGVWGVSFVVAMVNGAILDLTLAARAKRIDPWLLPPIILVVAVYGYGIRGLRQGIPSTLERPLRVAVLQPNLGVHKKFDPALVEPNTLANLAIYKEGCSRKPDLLVFPETTLPFPLFQEASRTLQFFIGF